MKDEIVLAVYRNVVGGYSLVIEDDCSGHRLAGSKVDGGEAVERFYVDVEELLEQIQVYSNSDCEDDED